LAVVRVSVEVPVFAT
jgi:hypothetical protein